MNVHDLKALLGGMTREQLERTLAILAATAPDEFSSALLALDE